MGRRAGAEQGCPMSRSSARLTGGIFPDKGPGGSAQAFSSCGSFLAGQEGPPTLVFLASPSLPSCASHARSSEDRPPVCTPTPGPGGREPSPVQPAHGGCPRWLHREHTRAGTHPGSLPSCRPRHPSPHAALPGPFPSPVGDRSRTRVRPPCVVPASSPRDGPSSHTPSCPSGHWTARRTGSH